MASKTLTGALSACVCGLSGFFDTNEGLLYNAIVIDLYYWTTPNGHKITVFLEEAQIDYKIIPVNIGRGEQFEADFLAIAPNNRIPAIVDHLPDGRALSVFESGAILLYLAEKTGRFLPADRRHQVIQWLMWQMGGLGPMLGQNHHFRAYADEQVAYAVRRYEKEAQRLYAVLNKQLEKGGDCICGEYSIADMACYPWIVSHEKQGINLAIIRKCADGLTRLAPAVRWCKLIKRAPP